MPTLPPLDPAAFERESNVLLHGLLAMLNQVLTTGRPIDGRQSAALATERLTTAISDMARAMSTFRRETEHRCLNDLLAVEPTPIGNAPAQNSLQPTAIQTVGSNSHSEDTLRQTGIQIPASNSAAGETHQASAIQSNATQQPELVSNAVAEPTPKRRRGAQPGNQHALKHGRFSQAAKAERAGYRAHLRRVRQLKIEARALAQLRTLGAPAAPPSETAPRAAAPQPASA